MEAKHTQGKWEASKSNADNTAIGIRSKTSLVATVWISKFYDDCPKKKEAEANAKIIESAPEMLKELIRLNGVKPRHPNHPESTFKSKTEYDKAYKKWTRTNKIIKKATE